MIDYTKLFSLRRTPQSEPIPGTVANSAGGFAFPVDDWARLDRFLVLGCEGGSYYASERELTRENAEAAIRASRRMARGRLRASWRSASPAARRRTIRRFSHWRSRLRLAMRRRSGSRMAAIPKVCRTGTHLFQFAEAIEGMRGWGRGLRRGIAAWYTGQPVDRLALQAVKYRQRGGWTHRDLLRLAHPVTDETGPQGAVRLGVPRYGSARRCLRW